MSTITTLNATSNIGDDRSTINTNLANLNADKLESTDIDTLAELNSILTDATLVDSAAVGLVANALSQFAATTSLQLLGVISDETGTGSLVFGTSPTLVTPALGTPASGVATNLTGTASGLTAGNVTTNANLTGHITSVGNGAVLGSFTIAQLNTAISDGSVGTGDALTSNGLDQFASTTSLELIGVMSDETGTGSLVFGTSPTLVTPALGTPSAVVLTNATGTAAGLTAGNVTTNANLTGHITSTGNGAILGSFSVAQLSTALSDATISGNNTGDQTTVSGTSGNTDALNSATTVVNVSSATAPTAGQVLKATSGTAATWQAESGGAPEGTAILSTGETVGKVLQADGDDSSSWVTLPGGGDALVANPLSQFAATTSAQLAGVLSDETGSGAAVFATSPTLVTPALGTPSALVATNATGTAAGLTVGATTGVEAGATADQTGAEIKIAYELEANTNAFTDANVTTLGNQSGTNTGDQTNITGNAATVTTNANLTGHITSTGNAAILGSFTAAQLSTALSDASISGTNTGDQTLPTDFDPAGTDNSTNVTLAGTGTYLSIAGQAITVDPITESDISDLGTYSTATGVADNADVTNTSSVTAAGALMDSEVTNLAQVKAFASADYATAAQGTTADAALPKVGGAMTGAITTNSTFDGRDVATDGSKLDTITVADITANTAKLTANTTNVTASGALMDSEVTNLAQVKAFSSADYATAAQGTTADSAMQDLSDDTTPQLGGNLDVNGQDIVSTSNANIDLAANGTGSVVVRGNDTSGKLVLNCEDNSHAVTIKGPPHSSGATYTLTLPNDDGNANGLMQSNGSGVLSFVNSATLTELDVTTLDMAGAIQEYAVNVTGVTGTTALSAAAGTIQRWVLSGNVNPTDSLSDGESITLIIDDGSGSTIDWTYSGLSVTWVGGSAPTLDTTNQTIIVIWQVNSTLYGMTPGVAS